MNNFKMEVHSRLEHCFTSDEREMLIRYCTRFTHDWSLAEDLAQQALLEAWLKSDHLYSQEIRTSWLIGMARKVCLRWLRRQRQEYARIAWVNDELSEISTSLEDDFDLEQDFERHELAQLLRKAVALLPPQTRTVLVQYYLEAVPQSEVASHLGVTIGAVEARLNRGKHALRHLLTHELREEAASYGLVTTMLADWQHTRIWCPICGQQHLLVKLPEPPGTIAFRCPSCSDNPEEIGWGYPLSNARFVQYLTGLTQPKSILRRLISWSYGYYFTAASHHGVVACAQCGQHRRLHLTLPAHLSEITRDHASRYGLSGHCPSCGWQDFCSPAGLLQSLPAAQRFWQAHPRMRLIFHEPIREVAGQRAWVASFESITDAAHLDVVLAQETLNLIDVHTNVH
jgi:RNA polymerase sigma factor (sigma-70 family)